MLVPPDVLTWGTLWGIGRGDSDPEGRLVGALRGRKVRRAGGHTCGLTWGPGDGYVGRCVPSSATSQRRDEGPEVPDGGRSLGRGCHQTWGHQEAVTLATQGTWGRPSPRWCHTRGPGVC